MVRLMFHQQIGALIFSFGGRTEEVLASGAFGKPIGAEMPSLWPLRDCGAARAAGIPLWCDLLAHSAAGGAGRPHRNILWLQHFFIGGSTSVHERFQSSCEDALGPSRG